MSSLVLALESLAKLSPFFRIIVFINLIVFNYEETGVVKLEP